MVHEEPNIQGIIFLKPISILTDILPSIRAAKTASAWRWELMDNWEGMVNWGHRIKYYLRAQHNMQGRKWHFCREAVILASEQMNDVHPSHSYTIL